MLNSILFFVLKTYRFLAWEVLFEKDQWTYVETYAELKLVKKDLKALLERMDDYILAENVGIPNGDLVHPIHLVPIFFEHIQRIRWLMNDCEVQEMIERLDKMSLGTFEDMQKGEDFRTLLQRTTIRLQKNNLYCIEVVSVFTDTTIFAGNIWGLPCRTLAGWEQQASDTKVGVQGTEFFNAVNGYGIVNYELARMMRDEAAVLGQIIDRIGKHA